MSSESSATLDSTYLGVYVEGAEYGQRAQLLWRVGSERGGGSELVLASGPRSLLDWETTADRANVAAAVLRHWLGRAPGPSELHEFLDQIAGEWVAGQPWELTGARLNAAGFVP